MMNVKKLLEHLDKLYQEGNLQEAELCINSWIADAFDDDDYGAALTFYNELEGLYRTTGRAGKAAETSNQALQLIEAMGLNGTVHHATCLQNGATANRWAGNLEKALDMYLQAAEIYKTTGQESTYQMASLYNNISHIYQEQNLHEKALEYLATAYKMVSEMENCQSEAVTTQVCMALSYMALGRMTQAKENLDNAERCYNCKENRRDGHYGSALSAMGEYYWRLKEYDKAVSCLEKALEVTKERFGENAGCAVIRKNIDKIKKEQAE